MLHYEKLTPLPAKLVLAVLLLFLSPDRTQAQAGEVADKQAIRAVVTEHMAAFNAHDAEAWVRLCRPDVSLVNSSGESALGVDEIRRRLTAVFSSRYRQARLQPIDYSVRFVRPDVAIVHTLNELSGAVLADGSPQASHDEISTRVLVKEGGAWRFAAIHVTVLKKK